MLVKRKTKAESCIEMAYKDFTWAKAKQDFGLQTVEAGRFLPPTEPIEPTQLLRMELERKLPWALSTGNEKARSEAIINPILLDLRDLLNQSISVFSGEQFNVDPAAGLNGYCDFLISRSPEQVEIEAPVVVVIEAKQENIKLGLGQCAATMVAAARFNAERELDIPAVYGSVTTGTAWRFLRLEGNVLTMDLMDYPIPPVEQLLGMLSWMVQSS